MIASVYVIIAVLVLVLLLWADYAGRKRLRSVLFYLAVAAFWPLLCTYAAFCGLEILRKQ